MNAIYGISTWKIILPLNTEINYVMQMRKMLWLLVCWFSPIFLFAQTYTYSGKVVDDQTGDVLPFVNILFGQKKQGVTTDVNGKFNIQSQRSLDTIRCSFVGYESLAFVLPAKKTEQVIKMSRHVVELNEFVVKPTENPAHRIIKAALLHRDKNNPMKNSSFSYTSYNKMVFTSSVFQDSSALRIAADTNLQDSVSKMKRRTVQFFTDQHLFMMESVNQRIFKAPDKNYEKVIASKISGATEPLLTFLITQVQGISFYDDLFLLLDKKYVNPISKGSTSAYFFEIQDTTYRQNDTVFIISFRPMKGSNFDGLKGLLYINSNGYAIQNVIAEPAKRGGGFNISIQQQYELVETQKWFPVQLNTTFYLNNIQTNGYTIIGKGSSSIQDIVLNSAIKNKAFGDAEVDMDVVSKQESEALLLRYRTDSLTAQERKTYSVVDSLAKNQNLDRWMNYTKSLMTNRLPIGVLDLDLLNIVRYNEYEGWRLGVGLYTNRKLMRAFTVGGYYAYGFGDYYNKYRVEGIWHINRLRNTTLAVAYSDDIAEAGGGALMLSPKELLDGDFIRRWFVTRFDRCEKTEVVATHRFFKYLTTRLELNVQTKTPMYHVVPTNGTPEIVNLFSSKQKVAESVLSMRFAYKEKFLKNGDWLFSMGTDYPIVYGQYAHGFSDLFGAGFEYDKMEIKVEKAFQYKYVGKIMIQLFAGISDRKLPLWGNFVAKTSFNSRALYSDNSFQSIKINTMVSDRYVSLFLKHSFRKRPFVFKKFKPEFLIHQNIMYGDLKYNDYLYHYNYKTPKSGYFESGIMMNKVLDLKTSAFGFGLFCNYGTYADLNFKNNFTLLWNFSLPIN